jgi:hypothetical protein
VCTCLVRTGPGLLVVGEAQEGPKEGGGAFDGVVAMLAGAACCSPRQHTLRWHRSASLLSGSVDECVVS